MPAFVFDKNKKINLVIYAEDVLNDSNNITDIVNNIMIIYDNQKDVSVDIDVEKVTSLDYAKDHLKMCIQQKTNEDILKRDFLDMEMYVRVNFGSYKVMPNSFENIPDEVVFNRANITMQSM